MCNLIFSSVFFLTPQNVFFSNSCSIIFFNGRKLFYNLCYFILQEEFYLFAFNVCAIFFFLCICCPLSICACQKRGYQVGCHLGSQSICIVGLSFLLWVVLGTETQQNYLFFWITLFSLLSQLLCEPFNNIFLLSLLIFIAQNQWRDYDYFHGQCNGRSNIVNRK